MSQFSLEGKIALITGASYGIGYGLATAYAAAGATIVFNDLSQESVDKAIAAYKADGITAHGYVCDVTDEDGVYAMVEKITKEIERLEKMPPMAAESGVIRTYLDWLINVPWQDRSEEINDLGEAERTPQENSARRCTLRAEDRLREP